MGKSTLDFFFLTKILPGVHPLEMLVSFGLELDILVGIMRGSGVDYCKLALSRRTYRRIVIPIGLHRELRAFKGIQQFNSLFIRCCCIVEAKRLWRVECCDRQLPGELRLDYIIESVGS